MELVNEWLSAGKFRKVGTFFRTKSTYEKELMASLTLPGNSLHKVEMEYNGKFGHTIVRIQYIALMSITYTCYTDCRMATQTVAPNINGFQGLKRCIQYIWLGTHINPYLSF